MPFAAPLAAGQAALAAGEWSRAYEAFDAAVAIAPDDPVVHEGRAMAAWWLDLADVVFSSREVAFRGYRAVGDARGAARIATWLAWDHDAFRGEHAIANGWLRRARELLAGDERCEEYAWLSAREAAFAAFDHSDPDAAVRFAEEAIVAARAAGSVDREMIGRALRGYALATTGRVTDGMHELDAVAVAILAGEMQDRVSIGMACCYLINACDRVRDYERAVQWCARLKAYCEKWQFRMLFAVCRTQYAAVCMWRGAWGEAEAELEAATRELTAMRPGMVSDALVRLGELRRRQGRLDEAMALFERAGHHPLAVVGRAAIAADRGDWDGALQLAERHLRQLPPHNRTERAAALELSVRCALARADVPAATTVLADLQAIAEAASTRPLRAMASAMHGLVTAATGALDDARRFLEDAVDLYAQSGATFERARAGLDLATILVAQGRGEQALDEIVRAEALLAPLEATAELDRGAMLRAAIAGGRDRARAESDGGPLGTTRTSARPAPPRTASLTPREREVLACIAEGMGNPAIATRLRISEHTVHRHVANLMTKLGVASRAAAVAIATREGVV